MLCCMTHVHTSPQDKLITVVMKITAAEHSMALLPIYQNILIQSHLYCCALKRISAINNPFHLAFQS